MPRFVARLCAALWIVLALVACGGDDDGGNSAVVAFGAELEGVYELTELDLNIDGCEPVGANVLSDGFLALYTLSGPRFSGLKVISCADVAACQTKVQDVLAPRSVSYNFHIAFDEQTSETTIAGLETTALQSGDSCQIVVTEAELARTEDTQIEIVARYWYGAQYSVGDEGFCDEGDGRGPSLEEDCNQYRSMTAERVADLAD